MPNYHIKFLPNIVNLIGYFCRLVLLPNLISADSSENSYDQSLDRNKVYSVHLKPFSNSSTYFLDEHPEHTFVHIADKKYILCGLVRELKFAFEDINSWFLMPEAQIDTVNWETETTTNHCLNNFIINLFHIREVKDFIANITIANLANVFTAHIIGDNNYNLIKNDSTYYMIESSCDKYISLLSRGTNECAVFTLGMIRILHYLVL